MVLNYRRWCHLKIDEKCKGIFVAAYRRSMVCDDCITLLRRLKLNIKRYKKMKDGEVVETIEWHDKDNATMVLVQQHEVKDGKEKTIGVREVKSTLKATFTEIEEGLNHLKDAVKRDEEQLAKFEKQLGELGKKPFRTPEIVSIQKALEDARKIEQIEGIEKKKAEVEVQMNRNKQWMEKRQKIMESRPK